jgi:hypothetical protein
LRGESIVAAHFVDHLAAYYTIKASLGFRAGDVATFRCRIAKDYIVTSSVMARRPGKNIKRARKLPFKLATGGLNSACCPSRGAGDGTPMQQIAEWLKKLGGARGRAI